MKKCFIISLALGLLSGFGLSPFNLLPVMILSIAGMFYLIDKNQSSKKMIFWIVFYFFLGYFLFALHWMIIPLYVNLSGLYILTIPFLVGIMFGVYSGLYAGISFIYYYTNKYHILIRFFILSLCLTIAEFIRGEIIFSGMPWNLIGYSCIFSESLSQLSSIFGIYGLTLYIFVVASIIVSVYIQRTMLNSFLLITGIIITSCAIYWGNDRLNTRSVERYPDMVLRIVQGNLPIQTDWSFNVAHQYIDHYINITRSADLQHVTHIVWPEATIHYAINKQSEYTKHGLISYISSILPQGKMLIAGTNRYEMKNDNIPNIWNSIVFIKDNKINTFYDKRHLVPFGEYIPEIFKKTLPSLYNMAGYSYGYQPGQGNAVIPISSTINVLPIICYESIFTYGPLSKENLKNVAFILQLTNDGWLGNSMALDQHFTMSRFRAIERGVSMVIAANKGISGVINPYGQVIHKIAHNNEQYMDVKIPVSLTNRTVYNKLL